MRAPVSAAHFARCASHPQPGQRQSNQLLPRGRAQNVNIVGTLIDGEILAITEMNFSSRTCRFAPDNLVRVIYTSLCVRLSSTSNFIPSSRSWPCPRPCLRTDDRRSVGHLLKCSTNRSGGEISLSHFGQTTVGRPTYTRENTKILAYRGFGAYHVRRRRHQG
jgi:hypothetical protein